MRISIGHGSHCISLKIKVKSLTCACFENLQKIYWEEEKYLLTAIMCDSSSDSDASMEGTNSTIEESDSDSDCVEGAMRGKITEKDPNFEKKKKCKCGGSCSSRSCSCYKYGSGCNSTCSCTASCENMFKHLDYFFGEGEKFDANPCFAKWLIKNGNNETTLKSINRDKLRKRILKCGRYPSHLNHSIIYLEQIVLQFRRRRWLQGMEERLEKYPSWPEIISHSKTLSNAVIG